MTILLLIGVIIAEELKLLLVFLCHIVFVAASTNILILEIASNVMRATL